MGRSADSVGREPAIRHGLFGHFRAFDHRKHDSLWAEIQGFFGPCSGGLREAEDGRSTGGGEGVEARKGGGDSTVAVFHVDDDEVVSSEAGDLGEGWGEGEEEEAVQGIAVLEAGFEGLRGGGG